MPMKRHAHVNGKRRNAAPRLPKRQASGVGPGTRHHPAYSLSLNKPPSPSGSGSLSLHSGDPLDASAGATVPPQVGPGVEARATDALGMASDSRGTCVPCLALNEPPPPPPTTLVTTSPEGTQVPLLTS